MKKKCEKIVFEGQLFQCMLFCVCVCIFLGKKYYKLQIGIPVATPECCTPELNTKRVSVEGDPIITTWGAGRTEQSKWCVWPTKKEKQPWLDHQQTGMFVGLRDVTWEFINTWKNWFVQSNILCSFSSSVKSFLCCSPFNSVIQQWNDTLHGLWCNSHTVKHPGYSFADCHLYNLIRNPQSWLILVTAS